jgi:hypothetical protein
MSSITHKRGDTFDHSGQFTSSGSEPVSSLAGWEIRSQARSLNGDLVSDFEASWIDASQRSFRLRAPDTSSWPIGSIKVDIQLTSPGGDVVSSPTFSIDIVDDVTK